MPDQGSEMAQVPAGGLEQARARAAQPALRSIGRLMLRRGAGRGIQGDDRIPRT